MTPLILALATITGIGSPTGCRIAAAADMAGIKVYNERDVIVEFPSVGLRRATGFYTAPKGSTDSDTSQAAIRLDRRSDKLGHPCLAFRWKVVPIGKRPVDGRDFTGNRLPQGVAILPSDNNGTTNAYIRVRPRDDFRSEPKETFAIQIMDEGGRVIWGTTDAIPDTGESRRGSASSDIKGITVTVQDTERECLRPPPRPPYKIWIEATQVGYELALQGPQELERCADVSWRYVNDDIPGPDPDAEFVMEGVARFTANRDTIAMTANKQNFPLFAYARGLAGRKVRVAWGTSSRSPAMVILTIPPRPKN